MAGESTELDGNGLDDLTPSEDAPAEPHLRYEAQLQMSLTRRSEVQTWEGQEAAIVAKFNATKIGELVPEADQELLLLSPGNSATSGEPWSEARVSNVSAPRRQGRVWTMQITISQLRWLTIWTLDFADIDKPIRTWHAGQQNGPDLAELSKQWEELPPHFITSSETKLGKDELLDYIESIINHGKVTGRLAGDTLKLAKMIREDGIESYTIHTPVVTCQITYPTFPDGAGGLLDCWFPTLPTPVGGLPDMGGYTESAVRDELDDLKTDFGGAGVPGKWLCTADPVHPNADGTYTRTTQFTLVSTVNEDLYGQGDPTAGGFNSSQSGGGGDGESEGGGSEE